MPSMPTERAILANSRLSRGSAPTRFRKPLVQRPLRETNLERLLLFGRNDPGERWQETHRAERDGGFEK
jgi:hypothetical protein